MQENTFWSRIKARRLASNVYTLVAFIILFVVSTLLYVLIPEGVSGEIFIAVSTSLLATIFISFFDIYTAYKNFETASSSTTSTALASTTFTLTRRSSSIGSSTRRTRRSGSPATASS